MAGAQAGVSVCILSALMATSWNQSMLLKPPSACDCGGCAGPWEAQQSIKCNVDGNIYKTLRTYPNNFLHVCTCVNTTHIKLWNTLACVVVQGAKPLTDAGSLLLSFDFAALLPF